MPVSPAADLAWALREATWMAENHRVPRYVDTADLAQDALIGYLDACARFDDGRGSSFRHYARLRMAGAMLDGTRSVDPLSRGERRAVNAAKEAGVNAGIMHKGNGETWYVPVDLVSLEGIRRARDDDEDGGYVDWLGALDPGYERLETLEYDADLVNALDGAFALLSGREQTMLRLYYDDGQTMIVIGRELGVSESRVSQVITHAVWKLRRSLSAFR